MNNAMTKRSLIFSGAMVRALREGWELAVTHLRQALKPDEEEEK